MAIELYIIYTIVLAALVLGTYTDFKVREVPDWVSYGLIFAGIGLRLIFSIINWDWHFIAEGLLGLGIFLAFSLVMFYTGQWGGGDAKVLMGLGALIGVQFSLDTFMLGFMINTIVLGALFGMGFSIFLAVTHKKAFSRELKKIYAEKNRQKYIFWGGSIFLLLVAFAIPLLRLALVMLSFLVFITHYLIVFIKAVEKSCMIKDVSPERLTEGDWILKDIRINGRYICGPKDLGIEQKQIDRLIAFKKQKKIKTITIKEGIPFVPSFLLGFIATLIWGNLFFTILYAI